MKDTHGKTRYRVNTYDYGVHWVYAANATAARGRVGHRIYGRHCWDNPDIDHWEVEEA